MNLLSPTSKAEVERSGWLFVALFILPLIPLGVLWWSAYPTADAHWRAFGTALVLSFPATVWAVRRASKLVELGIHRYYSKARPLGWRQYAGVWLGLLLVLYAWASAVAAIWVWLPVRPASEQSFAVAEAKQCTRRCLGCYRQAKLAAWPGSTIGSICVEGIDPMVQSGERLVVRGRFSSLGVHVQSVRRANAG